MREAMRQELGRKVLKFMRRMREMSDSYRDRDATRLQLFIVLRAQLEAVGQTVELRNQLLLQLRSKTLLEGNTVRNESLQANRQICGVVFDSFLGAKMPQGEGGFWIGKTRCKSVGFEQHTFRHVLAPRIHQAAKNAKRDRRRL